ncbi:MAG: EAL domain-containing protein [Deltaproteobacteria bacterium]
MSTITLPVRRPDDDARVLVIDDDPIMRTIAEEALYAADFEVVTAQDGAKGAALFETLAFDLVLLDLEMPGGDGFECCERIRSMPSGAHVPIVVMTAHDEPEIIARAYEMGATDYVIKPVHFAVLTHRLDYMLRATTANAALRESERRLANAQRIARVGHWEWRVGDEHVEMSPVARRVFGLEEEGPVLLDDLLTLVHREDRARLLEAIDDTVERRNPLRVEHRIQPEGEAIRIVYQEGEVGREDATGTLRLIATVQDITFRKEAERRIRHLTNFDATTNLPNQRLITERLERYVDNARDDGENVAVIAIDPDQFKRVNDSLGHKNGDELLRIYAERLGAALRRHDTSVVAPGLLGRSGRVGFVAILPKVRDAEEVAVIGEQIRAEIMAPYPVFGKSIYLSSSLGISVFPGDGHDADSLLESAAIALGEAKAKGRGSLAFYDDRFDAERTKRLTIEGRLRETIDEGAFKLVFQPKIAIGDRRVRGGEALLRWIDPELGFVSPADFIPVAEEAGLITRIDKWVLERSCEEAVRWRSLGLPNLCMAVNISAEQFSEPGFVDVVRSTLERTGLPPELLELELTERTLMNDSAAAVEILGNLRALGCRIALDDFGTGFSSLSYLTRFSVDTLKIDRAFITDVQEHADRGAIVRAIIAMSKSLRIQVVAEGVETAEELAFLGELECDLVQGYYFAKPLPSDDFLDYSGARLAG